ncbi:glycoside hydrolase family 127 protein [Pseudoxanthomonas sp. PXM03]|uniref:glycoside hydrolase family 127 protein n=1 Tax=Pseudoxanthomonas sp. PXM03 TaxID=2769284 RepID=UPI0017808EDA|nr:beta-L-arabinofuranosidase domain-containing protein [Pseudoxanthomonas sp. PXM03]MBD9434963.1 glycoside hydrolase family 127 protein [Pseudoxanthomonas sp. PXM03]
MTATTPDEGLQLPSPAQVTLGGVLGAALDANRAGRLHHFIVDEHSPAIALFAPQHVDHNEEGDWYGEHAGKWLVAAARAAARDGDAGLQANVRRVADYLVSRQQPDGYLGNYAPARRFMHPQPPKPLTWDGAPALRTWDIWTHSYLILGLLEVHRHFPDAAYLEAARRIGDLCWRVLTEGGIDITTLGNHHGMSATVLMDPAMELYFATGEARYLQLAEHVLAQADAHAPLALLTRALAGADAAEIATGKAYQLAWNLVGLAKLARATGEARYHEAVDRVWQSIRERHLTLGGGPWGGVAHRSREVFNAPGSFSPNAYVETCSLLAWIQLNRELLRLTGEARYAEEIERTAYNDLLGAHAPNGEDWCYYSFPNGRRVHTTYWRCCKSSGAMALEELPSIAYAQAGNAVAINVYGPGEARLVHPRAGALRLRQHTTYPFDGTVSLQVEPEHDASFEVRLRVPSWAHGATVSVNGEAVDADVVPGTFARVTRRWSAGDLLTIVFPLRPVLHHHALRNVQESRAPDGGDVRQQVLDLRYVGLTRGPLVYATELIDGFKTEETIRLPEGPQDDWLQVLPVSDGEEGAGIAMQLGYRAPLLFWPYYRAGGRVDGAWRLTWLSLPPA